MSTAMRRPTSSGTPAACESPSMTRTSSPSRRSCSRRDMNRGAIWNKRWSFAYHRCSHHGADHELSGLVKSVPDLGNHASLHVFRATSDGQVIVGGEDVPFSMAHKQDGLHQAKDQGVGMSIPADVSRGGIRVELRMGWHVRIDEGRTSVRRTNIRMADCVIRARIRPLTQAGAGMFGEPRSRRRSRDRIESS